MTAFDVAVIGAGMMGSAAARHLARAGHSVVLIGPEEPACAASHTGPFASHYDAARITRRLDTDRDWSRFATRAIARYGEIAEQGGAPFFTEAGCLMAGPLSGEGSGFMTRVAATRQAEAIPSDALDAAGLAERFPFLRFPGDFSGFHEPRGAGHIDPRAFTRASGTAAVRAGATLIRAEVTGIDETGPGVRIHCRDGAVVEAARALVATGAYGLAPGLLPEPAPLTVYARTIAFLEVDAAERARLGAMPSIITMLPDRVHDVYILPPVRYPDGRWYLKIGGDPVDRVLGSVEAISDWFRSGGSGEVRDFLTGQLMALMPGLRVLGVTCGACVTAFTPTGKPLIQRQSERIAALTGGNGAGAKCADELGRLGALAVMGEPLDAEGYEADFGPG